MYENRVKIDAAKKRIIHKDWEAGFPSLKKIKAGVFSKCVGPLSLRAAYSFNNGTDYKPAYSTINMLNVEGGLYACMRKEPPSRRYSITWAQHEKGLYKEAIKQLKAESQKLLPLEGPITLSQIIHAYKNYDDVVYGSYFYEDPALIAAWCGRPELAQELLDWGMEAFQEHYQVPVPLELETFENWYTLTQKRIQNPDALRALLGDEITRFKLEKVPYQDIIVDL